jgi:hypothetical protein
MAEKSLSQHMCFARDMREPQEQGRFVKRLTWKQNRSQGTESRTGFKVSELPSDCSALKP